MAAGPLLFLAGKRHTAPARLDGAARALEESRRNSLGLFRSWGCFARSPTSAGSTATRRLRVCGFARAVIRAKPELADADAPEPF